MAFYSRPFLYWGRKRRFCAWTQSCAASSKHHPRRGRFGLRAAAPDGTPICKL